MKIATRRFILLFALLFTQSIYADTTQPMPKCNEPTAEGDQACWMKVSNRDNCYVWNSELETNQSVSWSGACKAGVAHGRGEEIWQWDGELGGQATASGSYVNGKASGQWNVQFADGTMMSGPYVNGKANGPWEMRFADGTVATGSMMDGKANGLWEARSADGTVVTSVMVDGKANGPSEVRSADGTVETGAMVDDNRHGKWEIRYIDGRIDDVMYDKGEEIARAPRFNPKFAVDGDILRYNTNLAATEET